MAICIAICVAICMAMCMAGENYDKTIWSVLHKSDAEVRLQLQGSTVHYDVPTTRANKALLVLDPTVIAADIARGPRRCCCKRRCHTKFSVATVSSLRCEYLQAPSEVAALNALSRKLEYGTPKASSVKRPVIYRHGEVECCPTYFAHLLRISVDKLYKARSLFRGGGTVTSHSKLGTVVLNMCTLSKASSRRVLIDSVL
jgi:hypothetical protein